MYDYIIVGAGSAGCVLANKLSEDPNNKVCLLEAGPDDKSFLIRMPLAIAALMWDPRHNWMYRTEPEPYMNNREMYQPRGKVVGGSSSTNAMIYIRGIPRDYDEWESLGNPGWGWKDLLPYFKAGEKQQHGASELHGDQGLLNVVDLVEKNPLCDSFIQATADAGVAPLNNDFNGPDQEGVGYYQLTQDGAGKRMSIARAYLNEEVRKRPNLTIITKALTSKVLFEGKKAVGVEYIRKGKTHQIKANKEVILSGGAINSPQLLMLSGVGPADELNKHKIETVHELPGVGKNLQDHMDILVNVKEKGYKSLGLSIPFLFRGAAALVKYILGKPSLFSSNTAEAGAFLKSDPSLPYPDIQIHFGPVFLESHFLRRLGHGYSLHLCNLRPKSRGKITLKSNKPKDKAKILFNYLKEPEDMDVMVKCIDVARKICRTDVMQAHTKEIINPPDSMQSREEIEAFIREKGETIYHPVGTCKMGNDEMAVVDHELKVHGINNLRVADASIMPTLIGGNTNAPVAVIASKAADIILGKKL